MNNIMQFIGTFASIFSIPLAIILYLKTSDARQNKIRLDIIRSLSYRIGEGKSLDHREVTAVFKSKVREHNIRKPFFTETTILEDIIADAVSNPFLVSEQKTLIINNVGSILSEYDTQNSQPSTKPSSSEHHTESSKSKFAFDDVKSKQRLASRVFGLTASMLSVIITSFAVLEKKLFADFFSNIHLPIEIFASLAVTIFAVILTIIIEFIVAKKRK